jgi:hypothetical protein
MPGFLFNVHTPSYKQNLYLKIVQGYAKIVLVLTFLHSFRQQRIPEISTSPLPHKPHPGVE